MLEIDTDFNVNILTSSSGEMMGGGLGGVHEAAGGVQISIAAIPIIRGCTLCVVKKVLALCTPGETVKRW